MLKGPCSVVSPYHFYGKLIEKRVGGERGGCDKFNWLQ